MIVRDSHQSLYHGASDDQKRAAIEAACRVSSVAMFTEANGCDDLVPAGFRSHGTATEMMAVWDASEWSCLASLPPVFTSRSWYLGNRVVTAHQRHGVTGVAVLLLNLRTSLRLLRVGLHSPSSVQGGAGWSPKPEDRDNVNAAKAVLRNVGPVVEALQLALRPDETTLSADWNLHLGVDAHRRRVNQALTGTGMQLRLTGQGTHAGGREIDAIASTMPVARGASPPRARDLPGRDGIDHKRVDVALAAPGGREKR